MSDDPIVPKVSLRPGGTGVKPSRILSNRAIVISAVLVVLLAVGAAWLLLDHYGGGSDADKARLEAIRTVGTIVLGAGGAIALLLAARRQQTAERDLAQKERVQLHAEQDATERRITELYSKAGDQLASEKAPVRLTGLYALERLAQSNPEYQQTIVSILCAYLRMPYDLPGDPPELLDPDGGPHSPSAIQDALSSLQAFRERVQEREVRLTAQSILSRHLRHGRDAAHQDETFWPGIDVDLTSAVLIDFDLTLCHLRTAQFKNASFIGPASFDQVKLTETAVFRDAEFAGTAEFSKAKFAGDAAFSKAKFAETAAFSKAEFAGDTEFSEAEFTGNAVFNDAEFAGDAAFSDAEFARIAAFRRAKFAGHTEFNEAKFAGTAAFSKAKFAGYTAFNEAEFAGTAAFSMAEFAGDAMFVGAEFAGHTVFAGAEFAGDAEFSKAKFAGNIRFSETKFAGTADFELARVRLDNDDAASQSWPTGWTLSTVPPVTRPDVLGDWTQLVAIAPDSDGGASPAASERT